ncbi:MAG: hypothetical protein IPK67_15305 [Planctomycetes bacterium]|nr:hypothetical protein [Planctomycetota bacterium]
MAPLFVGGCVRALCERGSGGAKSDGDPGVLAASGPRGGREGPAGVAIAGLVAGKVVPRASEASVILQENVGAVAVVVTILAVCGFLYVSGRRR